MIKRNIMKRRIQKMEKKIDEFKQERIQKKEQKMKEREEKKN